jgi:hypothetical protein
MSEIKLLKWKLHDEARHVCILGPNLTGTTNLAIEIGSRMDYDAVLVIVDSPTKADEWNLAGISLFTYVVTNEASWTILADKMKLMNRQTRMLVILDGFSNDSKLYSVMNDVYIMAHFTITVLMPTFLSEVSDAIPPFLKTLNVNWIVSSCWQFSMYPIHIYGIEFGLSQHDLVELGRAVRGCSTCASFISVDKNKQLYYHISQKQNYLRLPEPLKLWIKNI